MAEVKFFKSILEDSYETFTAKPGMTIEGVVKEYGDDNVYSENLVECYDVDTGKTFYAPLTDNEDFGVMAVVNGKSVSKEYVLQEDDSVVVMVMPHSGNNGDDNWSWKGAAIGLGLGLVLGAVTGGVGWWYAFTSFAEAAAWVTAGAVLGGAVGFLAGGIVGAQTKNKKESKDYRDGSQLPDVGGANNQPITGNPIPLVLGKKEISPFIVGSPWVEYTGAGGKDAWLHILYCVGYGPLSLTDFKFDCLVFSNNARKVFAGKLSGSEFNDGDIKMKWDANDIELEIIQQNTNSNVMYYGDIYPYAKKQENVGATPLFIRDKQLTDSEVYNQMSKDLIQYMNGTYDNGFRTNSIRFTEQYTRRIEVTLDLPEGAYFERNTDNGEPEKKSIPLWVAIQWRPYSEKAEKAERSKSGTIATRSDGNYAYELSAGNSDGWIPFDYIDVDGAQVAPSNYDRNSDLAAHTGNDLRIDEYDTSEEMSNDQAIEALRKNISIWGVTRKEDIWVDNWVTSKNANMRCLSTDYDGLFINTMTIKFVDGEKKYTWIDEEGDLWVSNEFYEQYKGKNIFAGVTDKFFYSLDKKTEYGKTYHRIHAKRRPVGYLFDETLLRECFTYPSVNKPYKSGTRNIEGWIPKKSLKLLVNVTGGPGGWGFTDATFVNGGETYDLSGEARFIYLPNTYDGSFDWDFSEYDYNYKLTTVEVDGIKYKKILCTNWPKKNTHYDSVNYGNENWLNAKAFNLQTVQDDVSSKAEKTNISKIRVTAHANIEEYCKKNNRKPSSWLYSDDNTTKAIEVRVVRISPNYINEVASDANNKKPKTFHDSLLWKTITSSTIDIKDENNTFNSTSEEGLHTVQNKLNGGINLFAIPKYSMIFLKDEGWDIPEENEDKVEVFYGVKKVVEIDGKNHLVYATPVSNEEWLSPGQLDSYIDAYVENGFSEDLKQHIAFHAPYDTDAEIENAQALIGEINFEANRYYLQNSLSGIDKMIYSRPISNRHYKDMCLIALKVKADAAGNVQGQLEKLSVIAQTFAPKLAHNVWFPQNIRKKQRYFYGNKKEIVDTSEKTAKELYEEAVANGDVNAICVNGGNNWRSSMDSIIFGSASSAEQENIFIKSGETEAYSGWYLTDGEHNNNSSPSQFMLACVGSHLGKDALGYEDVNQLSVSEWHDKSVNVIDGTCTPEERNAASIFMACNGYVYSKLKFEDLLSKIAFSGRAAFTRDDSGKIVVVMDNKVPYPKGILNNQNALSVSISYSFKPSPSGVMVTFRNEANFGIDEGLMVMNDGENEYNPSNDVETLSLDFVTDIIQAYSLGRYYLATKEFSRDALNWKSGIEGFDLQFGDVVKVNHDMLLVGQSCGRITEILCDEQYAYGLILSDSYEYDGKDDHAIEIMQPGQYGSDKVIVVPVNSHVKTESGSRKAISHTYIGLDGKEHTIKTPRKGLSNLVVFNDKMFIGGTYTFEGKTYFFKPQLDNLVNYGIKDKVSRLYRVKTKTPDANFTFNYLLVPYDERFYNYGADIPVINRNITVPSRDSDKSISVDDKASLTDVLSKMEEAKSYADEAIAEAKFDATAVYQLAIATPVLTKNPDGTYVKDELVLKSKKTSGTITEVYPTIYHVTYFDSDNVEQHLYDSETPDISVTLTTLPIDTFRFHVSANYLDEAGKEVEFDNQDVQIIESGEQGYTVGLTNENHGFPGDTEKALESVATTSVYALSGDKVTEARVVSVDKLGVSLDFADTSIPGLKFKVSTLEKAERPVITFKATPDLIIQSGNVSVIIEVNKIQIEKSFSFTVSRKGEDGDAPYILVIEGENIIRNGNGTVTLTPSLTKGGKEVEIVPPEMKIQWYLNDKASKTYAAGNYVSDAKLELTAQDVGNKILINCKLEDSLG